FVYDYDDRLVSVTDLSTGMAVPVASYAYDAMGNRISKTTYPPSPLPPVTTEFVYGGAACDRISFCGNEIIEEWVGGVLSATHVFDGGSHGNQRYTGDSSICTGRHLLQTRGGQTYFTHADDLGNVL